METKQKQAMAEAMRNFELPKYRQLPNMGLYLEQTTKYINTCLSPMGCVEVTGSMIRNYVKMGLVKNPVQKQYYADQIAHLIAITVLKQVMPLEQISRLFLRQQRIYSDDTAYDYFCMELQNILQHRFGIKKQVEDIGSTQSIEKEMLRSAVIAVSHIIFLNACMEYLQKEENA